MQHRPAVILAVCFGLGACSLLAPSDEELGGGLLTSVAVGGNGTGASGAGGSGGAGGESPCPDGYADGDGDPENGCEVPTEGMKFWYAGDDTTPSPEGLIQWVDRSGASRNAFQNDSESRPTAVPQALNNLPVVRFDGVDDNLGINPGFADLGGGITFAAVVQRADGVGPGFTYATLLDLKNTPSDEGRYFSRSNDADSFVYGLAVAALPNTLTSPAGSFPADVPVLIVVVHEPNRVRVRTCQSEVEAAIANPGSLQHDSVTIGTNRGDPIRNYNGDVAEMMFYRRPLDDADLGRVESYLIDKWQICP